MKKKVFFHYSLMDSLLIKDIDNLLMKKHKIFIIMEHYSEYRLLMEMGQELLNNLILDANILIVVMLSY
jgi:hypothetical protein